jgi:prophage DNA circulation protein
MPSIVSGWVALPGQMIKDAQGIANSIKGLGKSYGPYALGSTKRAAQSATPASLLAAADLQRVAAAAACSAAVAAAATGVAATVATAVQAVPTAVRAAIVEPTDQIRALLAIAAYAPAITTATDPVGLGLAKAQTATQALCLYATLGELANAAAAYQFTSQNQAATVSAQVAAALANGLRSAVVSYLAGQGAVLAPLRTVTFRAPLPALVIAQRLYQNGMRADELIRNAVPWHPAFMPMSLTVPAT